MTPERWARLEPLIDEALDVAPELRAAYYDRAMADDSILRAELERLVAECERRDSLLDAGAGVRFGGAARRHSSRRADRRGRVAASSIAGRDVRAGGRVGRRRNVARVRRARAGLDRESSSKS